MPALSKHHGRIDVQHGISRVYIAHRNILFGAISESELNRLIDAAAAVGMAYYNLNLEKSSVRIPPDLVEELILHVALDHIHLYKLWKDTNPRYKHHNLSLATSDFSDASAQLSCIEICKRSYGAEYWGYAAAILGITEDILRRRETSRDALNRMRDGLD